MKGIKQSDGFVGVLLLIAFMVVMGAGIVFAASLSVTNAGNTAPYAVMDYTYTLASDNTGTAPGVGTEYSLGVPVDKFDCVVSFQTTTTPTASTMNLEGSMDGTYWRTISSVTTTLSTGNFMSATTTDELLATRIRPNMSVMTKETGASWAKIRCVVHQ